MMLFHSNCSVAKQKRVGRSSPSPSPGCSFHTIALAHDQFKTPLWALSVAVALIGLVLVIDHLGVLR